MKLTNKFNLPETIINVIKRPTYSKGKAHISVTELMTAPQIVLLKRKHWDEIEQTLYEEVGVNWSEKYKKAQITYDLMKRVMS